MPIYLFYFGLTTWCHLLLQTTSVYDRLAERIKKLVSILDNNSLFSYVISRVFKIVFSFVHYLENDCPLWTIIMSIFISLFRIFSYFQGDRSEARAEAVVVKVSSWFRIKCMVFIFYFYLAKKTQSGRIFENGSLSSKDRSMGELWSRLLINIIAKDNWREFGDSVTLFSLAWLEKWII